MASESNGRKPDSQEQGPVQVARAHSSPPSSSAPTSGTAARQSARAPSAWGATRDALASVYNLEALLRSGNVLYKTILDLLAELRSSAAVLREAFERARSSAMAAAEVGEYGAGRVEALVELLDATALADEERDDLADRAHALADELEATADLLALLERATEPAPTDVNVALVVRETARLSRSARGYEVAVRFDESTPDATVHADPYVVGPLLSLLAASVHAAGVDVVAVRARFENGAATFVVEAAVAGDAARPTLTMRVLPVVPPTAAAVRQAAAQIGAVVELEPARGSLRLKSPLG
jgi:hypothetical protein